MFCSAASRPTPGSHHGARLSPIATRILIGAFENTTGDADFDETLGTALSAQLNQSPFLDIVSDQRVRETLRSMGRPADDRLTSAVAREVCQRLGLKAMLDGSIAPLGTSYVLSLNATDCQTGEPLAREQAEAAKERVFSELGSMSSRMRRRLGESLPSIQRFDVPIEQATTPSLTALKAYALGLEERRRGRELESVAFFNQAIELDQEFASAYATLSTVYGSIGEWQRSEEYARLAFGLQKRVSERERLFITYQYHDRVTGNQEKAASTLELWKTAYPARVAAGECAGADPSPHGALRSRRRRSARGVAAVAGASVPALEPGDHLPVAGPLRGREEDR